MASGTSTTSDRQVSVLFVCLGNICRSPMAEGVFRHLTNFETSNPHPLIAAIDSCGTGAYHAGDRPDSRTLTVLKDNGLSSYKHAARKVRVPEDFEKFDYLIAMDEDNYMDLRDLVKRTKKNKGTLRDEHLEKVRLYGEFGGKDNKEEIGDPYYGGREGFTIAYEQVVRCGKGLLKEIEEGAKAAE
ncbi:low molecular weight phosphotyrosine protein phosphatase [Zymoseptoria brevis]|uniref:Low molecular weight phosphotyrosine protein phosphatase n=1 Tax=Zymoseptoria brevis TaxID=1047168 RepID=A0A0F4GU55_9PEZI|nr:low molecular weight phosphotyrosine protein phosphatase [Zymoseptoria brevis]